MWEKHFFKKFQHDHNHWKFFDLEKHADYEYITRDPDLFFNKNPNHVIIDEVQILPEIFFALRVTIDSDRLNAGRFIMLTLASLFIELNPMFTYIAILRVLLE